MPQITLAEEFFRSLVSSETSNHFTFADYFEHSYSREYDSCASLPTLLSYQKVSVSSPFSYETCNLNAFCMILTSKGSGTLNYMDHVYELTPGTLAFLDCRLAQKIVCRHNIWEFTICFISRTVTEFYYKKLCPNNGCCFTVTSYTDVLTQWNMLLRENTDDELHALRRSRTLISLFTEMFILRSMEASESYRVPTYLQAMKQRFDVHCEEQFSLDDLAQFYHINKYRLCREFTAYFNDSPLQYLNKVRIERAKELLITTDEKVGVIGQMVGIENTNHFIRLFKEKTGVTPLRYRKETPVI